MCTQFFIVVRLDTDQGLVELKTHKEIALHYLRNWFLLDLVSLVPFDIFGMVQESETSVFNDGSLLVARFMFFSQEASQDASQTFQDASQTFQKASRIRPRVPGSIPGSVPGSAPAFPDPL